MTSKLVTEGKSDKAEGKRQNAIGGFKDAREGRGEAIVLREMPRPEATPALRASARATD